MYIEKLKELQNDTPEIMNGIAVGEDIYAVNRYA